MYCLPTDVQPEIFKNGTISFDRKGHLLKVKEPEPDLDAATAAHLQFLFFPLPINTFPI